MKKMLLRLGIFAIMFSLVLVPARPVSAIHLPPTQFSVTISPGSVQVAQGQTADYTGTVEHHFFILNLQTGLSLAGAPPGSTVTFVPPGTPLLGPNPYNYTLSIGVPAGATPGVYNIAVTAKWFISLPPPLGNMQWGNETVSAILVVVPSNQPPDISNAAPSITSLWPPNHKFVSINIEGVTDPDGDPITISIDGIMQDELVGGPGSGNTAPDGQGVGTDTVEVRAEREGGGNGRVYHIMFTADDGNGGTVSGEVVVTVPHDKKGTAVDDGALYDSTIP